MRVRPPWRPRPLPRYALPDDSTTIVPPVIREKLQRAADLMRAATRPDGRVVQIGDTDSGRLFKLTPVGTSGGTESDRTFREDTLDHRSTIGAIGALFGVHGGTRALDAVVIDRLSKRRTVPMGQSASVTDHGDIDAVVAAIEALPAECRRCRRIDLGATIAPGAWRRAAFPRFGLYVFKAGRAFIAFRCKPAPESKAPLGHTHDDNLAIEYHLGETSRIDPGALCYTPSRALRNLYRSADAHDVPRAIGWDVAPPGWDLFDLDHHGWAQCRAWGSTGVAGEIATARGRLWRALRLTPTSLEIWDGVEPPNRLRAIAPQIDVAIGYGRIVGLGEPSRDTDTQPAGLRAALSPDACHVA